MNLSSLPEWDLYREILRNQIETRKNTIAFQPLASMEQALQQEYQKGEVSGIYLTMNMLDLTIEALDQEILARKFDENEEDA